MMIEPMHTFSAFIAVFHPISLNMLANLTILLSQAILSII